MPKEPAAQKPQLPSIGGKKKKLQEELSSGGKLRQSAPVRAESNRDTQQAPSALGRWLGRLWGWLRLQVWGCTAGPKKRGHSARIRTPPHHREQWAERRVEEKRDNAGPGWRFRTLHGSPAPLPPRAASCRAKFAAPPSLLGPGGEAAAADLPPPRRHRLPPRGAAPGSPRGGGARASRMGPAKGAGRAGESRELEGRRARDGKGTRKEAARTKGAGRAGERGARRSPRTRCLSGGFSNEVGSAPRFSVRYESSPRRHSLPAILARPPLGSHQEGQRGEGRRPRLPPGLGPRIGGHPGASAWRWKRK